MKQRQSGKAVINILKQTIKATQNNSWLYIFYQQQAAIVQTTNHLSTITFCTNGKNPLKPKTRLYTLQPVTSHKQSDLGKHIKFVQSFHLVCPKHNIQVNNQLATQQDVQVLMTTLSQPCNIISFWFQISIPSCILSLWTFKVRQMMNWLINLLVISWWSEDANI